MAQTDPLQRKLKQAEKSLKEKISRREKTATQAAASPTAKSASVVQLPLWGEERRGVPNDLVRSALFTVGNKRNKRSYLKEAIIAALGDVRITYTGEELRQDDEDVFLQILHLARLTPLGELVEVTAYALLKSLGWPTDGRTYARLKKSLIRLKATSLSVSNGPRGYSGSLIRSFEWRDMEHQQSRTWKICLEPRIIALFGHVAYTQIVWEQRQQLGPLAKWLHSFYFTHANPYALKVKTLKTLCGSTVKDLYKFRQNLKNALAELENVGFLDSWRIDQNDNVHVVRIATSRKLSQS